MEPDTGKPELRMEELRSLAKKVVVEHLVSVEPNQDKEKIQQTATKIVNCFVRDTLPEKETQEEPLVVHIIRISPGGVDNPMSIRLGNIFLNFRQLIFGFAAAGLALNAAAGNPWVTPLAALVIWNTLLSNLKVTLSDLEGAVIWTMWTNKDENYCISKYKLLNKVNLELTSYKRSSIDHTQLNKSLRRLSELGCIERLRTKWQFRDWVQIR